MNPRHLSIVGLAAIATAWSQQIEAMEMRVPAGMEVKPTVSEMRVAAPAVAGMVMAPRARTAWNTMEFVFTGKLDSVKYGPVGRSFPPVYSVELTFTVEKSIRGSLKAGEQVTFHDSVRQQDKPTYPEGEICLVGGRTGDHGMKSLAKIEKANQPNVDAASADCQLPIGWMRFDNKPVSPWAAFGVAIWPKEAGNLGATTVCSKTGRPALLCGEGIELTVKPAAPAKSIQWTNPDGDGDYEISVTNKTDKPIQVPALLTDGQEILWANSLVILCQDKAYATPGCKTGLAKISPVELQPGQSVTGTISPLGLVGPEWPQGGYRIAFQFCLGEKSVSHSFYYTSKHHDPIRDAKQKANPPPDGAALKLGQISWDEMVGIIKANELEAVYQTHDRTVTVKTKDGKSYTATAPQIDLVFKIVKESGHPVPPMATE